MDPRDRKIALGTLAILVLLTTLALFTPNDQPPESEIPSSYSASSGGAKAAYLLLEQQGYDVRRWIEPPQSLPSDPAAETLILAVPTDRPTETERGAIADFVRKGGRVLAVGPAALAMFKDLEPQFKPGLPAYTRRQFRALVPGRMASDAQEISMHAGVTWRTSGGQLALYGGDDGAVVVRIPYGRGEVLWWAGPTPLTNVGLRDAGSVELLLNSLGPPGSRILWDEYFHGLEQGMGHLLGQTPLPWALLQCGLLFAIAIWTFSRRSGPIHEPAEPSRLSPLEYAETLGGLYRRAHASDVAVEVALERFRMLAARKLGLRADLKAEDLYAGLQSRFHFKDPEFTTVLDKCESAKFNSKLDRNTALKLTQALHRYAIELKLADQPGENS